MGRIIVDISPSVDGYVAGRGVSVQRPFGDAGLRLHRWIGFEGAEPDPDDDEAAKRMFAGVGAVLLGRTMFDVGIGTWGPDGAFGLPCFVVTNRPEPDVVRGPTTFTFVTGGVGAAIDAARAAAGDRDVLVNGGARLVRQCLDLGVVDELRLHVVPVLLGGGTRAVRRGAAAGAAGDARRHHGAGDAPHVHPELTEPAVAGRRRSGANALIAENHRFPPGGPYHYGVRVELRVRARAAAAVRGRLAVLLCLVVGAAGGALAGCSDDPPPKKDPEAQSVAVPGRGTDRAPAFEAGGACQLLDFLTVEQFVGVTFEVAASSQKDATATCVLQRSGAGFPDFTLAVTPTTVVAGGFKAAAAPPGAVDLAGVGQAAYQFVRPAASTDPAGPGASVEIGWLSRKNQLMVARYRLPGDKPQAEAEALLPQLVELAKFLESV